MHIASPSEMGWEPVDTCCLTCVLKTQVLGTLLSCSRAPRSSGHSAAAMSSMPLAAAVGCCCCRCCCCCRASSPAMPPSCLLAGGASSRGLCCRITALLQTHSGGHTNRTHESGTENSEGHHVRSTVAMSTMVRSISFTVHEVVGSAPCIGRLRRLLGARSRGARADVALIQRQPAAARDAAKECALLTGACRRFKSTDVPARLQP